MGPALAVLASLAWGWSTHEAARGAGRLGSLRLTAWSQASGLLILIPCFVLSGEQLEWRGVLAGAAAGVGSGWSLALLYDACTRMAAGPASGVSGAGAGVFTLLVVTLSGAGWSPVAAISMVPCVVGILLVSLPEGRADPLASIDWRPFPTIEAFASGFLMTIYYVALGNTDTPLESILVARLVASAFLFAALRRTMTRAGTRIQPGVSWIWPVLSVGISGSFGTIAYSLAATRMSTVASVAIAATAPAVTGGLGFLRYGDRLRPAQIAGLGACIVGAGLASLSAA